MNKELIQKLFSKSCWDEQAEVDIEDFISVEKFAELIVKECLSVVEKQKVFDTGYDRTQAIKHDALLVGHDDCTTSIIHGLKEHFGVKE